jgi:hypothetical protein
MNEYIETGLIVFVVLILNWFGLFLLAHSADDLNLTGKSKIAYPFLKRFYILLVLTCFITGLIHSTGEGEKRDKTKKEKERIELRQEIMRELHLEQQKAN